MGLEQREIRPGQREGRPSDRQGGRVTVHQVEAADGEWRKLWPRPPGKPAGTGGLLPVLRAVREGHQL